MPDGLDGRRQPGFVVEGFPIYGLLKLVQGGEVNLEPLMFGEE